MISNFLYVFLGGVCFLWSILWFVFVYDSPEVHPWISEKEKSFLKNKILNVESNKTKVK